VLRLLLFVLLAWQESAARHCQRCWVRSLYKNQSKAADKAAATKIKGLINDTSSTLFDDIKWAVNLLAPFQSAIKEVRYMPLMKTATDFCQLA
jgi:hypothetical protein